MDIEQIKKWLEEELSKGNSEPYKKLRSFCNRLYRLENKDKVALYNQTQYSKIKKHTEKDTIKNKNVRETLKSNSEKIKKHTENTTQKEIKKEVEEGNFTSPF